ncbi:MAG TPA: type II 3-dehydroquinate dehydratase [Acidimicrobiia bacterium]|nr:type II 3-dehydroquinate dehydratase [Acidimicrobiia bacterium]
MDFLVVNGPNLNLLGTREPEVYGSTTLDDLNALVVEWASGMGASADCLQSNSEAEIIDAIHGFTGDGIVINPGALTHTSHAIADAIRGVSTPAVEVHISNVRQRESWRAVSFISDACVRTIYGRGVLGYRNAMRHLINRVAVPFETVRYGPHQDNVADLRSGGAGLAVLVHGGLWREEYERDSTESLAVDLNQRGMTTLNLEYRRLGSGGGWPGSGHDVLTALEALPRFGVEVERVVGISHSAGSYLMTWAAERSSSAVETHVALAPILDLAAAVAADDPGAGESAIFLDSGAPPVAEPSRVSTAIVHGVGDQIVPVEHSDTLADRLGLQFHRTVCDHYSLLDPTKPEWEWVVDHIGA